MSTQYKTAPTVGDLYVPTGTVYLDKLKTTVSYSNPLSYIKFFEPYWKEDSSPLIFLGLVFSGDLVPEMTTHYLMAKFLHLGLQKIMYYRMIAMDGDSPSPNEYRLGTHDFYHHFRLISEADPSTA